MSNLIYLTGRNSNENEKNTYCKSYANKEKEKDNKQQFKFYKDPVQNRVFFHSITGEIINNSSDDSENEIENNDLIELQMNTVDDFTDICEKDKIFFKLWGRYIARK